MAEIREQSECGKGLLFEPGSRAYLRRREILETWERLCTLKRQQSVSQDCDGSQDAEEAQELELETMTQEEKVEGWKRLIHWVESVEGGPLDAESARLWATEVAVSLYRAERKNFIRVAVGVAGQGINLAREADALTTTDDQSGTQSDIHQGEDEEAAPPIPEKSPRRKLKTYGVIKASEATLVESPSRARVPWNCGPGLR